MNAQSYEESLFHNVSEKVKNGKKEYHNFYVANPLTFGISLWHSSDIKHSPQYCDNKKHHNYVH